MARVNRLYYPNGTQRSDFDHTLTALQAAHGYDTSKNMATMSDARKRHIAHHFMYTKGDAWPPERYIDLAGPVVSGQHKLSKAKVDNLDARNYQIHRVPRQLLDRGQRKIDRLQRENW